jgi:MFS family permease
MMNDEEGVEKAYETTETDATTSPSSLGKDSINRSLTKAEQWNIACLVMAYACVVASLAVVVGTGPLIVKSVGGSSSLAPFALGAFFLGMSLISLTCTHWIFAAWGRRYGFLTGISFSLFGVVLGCISIVIQSPALVIITNIFVGAGSGVSMYLRFAAIEVVPPHYQARAVAWVLSGGCLAAFVGPESAQAAKFMVPEYEYLGLFIVAGIFFVAQAICIRLTEFPSSKPVDAPSSCKPDGVKTAGHSTCSYSTQELMAVVFSREFLVPLLIATFSWAIMAMPMGIFRVAMKDLGYSERESLTVIEFHFLAMYSPGFYTGGFLQRHGPHKASILSVGLLLTGVLINIFATQDNTTTVVTWYLGLIFLGAGWNFGFSAATLWMTDSYMKKRNPINGESLSHLKPQVQAANECGMFLLSGAGSFATGFIYQAGGGALDGWKVLNYSLLGLIGAFGLTLLWAGTATSTASSATVGLQDEDIKPGLPLKNKELPQHHSTTGTEVEQTTREDV